eukprot:9935-Amphidinium_carterae.1
MNTSGGFTCECVDVVPALQCTLDIAASVCHGKNPMVALDSWGLARHAGFVDDDVLHRFDP